MLLELSISNFALIKETLIRFRNCLNVLSGETGAGKSIIFEALSICLGERASKNMIKSGEEHSVIEATFSITDSVKVVLEDLGLYDGGEVFTIRRDIFLDYPSVSRINGFSVTLNNLKLVSSKICDIYGQYEHQILLNSDNYLPMIDSLNSNTSDLLVKVERLYKDFQDKKKDLDRLLKQAENLNQEIDYVEFQINEILNLNLKPGEDESLQIELSKLENYQLIYNSLMKARVALKGFEGRNDGGISFINEAMLNLDRIYEFDNQVLDLKKRLESALYEIDDISESLDSLIVYDFDESELEEINFRLSNIQSIKKKYNMSISEIILYADKLKKDLYILKNIDTNIKEKEIEVQSLKENYNTVAKKLSNSRKKTAIDFEKKIQNELKELDMHNINFEVHFSKKEYSIDGIDEVEFMVVTNKGSDFKPIREVISGGEMSRFMLAIKKILSDYDENKTLVFDEIDAGLSGKVANSVGNRLLELSKSRQVILISHLPQIISKADLHFKVIKYDELDETVTRVIELDRNERINEIARLLSGDKISEATIKNAKELIDEKRD